MESNIFKKLNYLLLILIFGCISVFGSTSAYFKETVTSKNNTFSTGSLEIETEKTSFNWKAPLPSPNSINTLVSTTTKIKNTGTADLNYEVEIDNHDGNLCSELNINGNSLNNFKKDGMLQKGEDT